MFQVSVLIKPCCGERDQLFRQGRLQQEVQIGRRDNNDVRHHLTPRLQQPRTLSRRNNGQHTDKARQQEAKLECNHCTQVSHFTTTQTAT